MIKVNTPEIQAFETEHLNQLRALAPECMVLLKKNGDFPLSGLANGKITRGELEICAGRILAISKRLS